MPTPRAAAEMEAARRIDKHSGSGRASDRYDVLFSAMRQYLGVVHSLAAPAMAQFTPDLIALCSRNEGEWPVLEPNLMHVDKALDLAEVLIIDVPHLAFFEHVIWGAIEHPKCAEFRNCL